MAPTSITLPRTNVDHQIVTILANPHFDSFRLDSGGQADAEEIHRVLQSLKDSTLHTYELGPDGLIVRVKGARAENNTVGVVITVCATIIVLAALAVIAFT